MRQWFLHGALAVVTTGCHGNDDGDTVDTVDSSTSAATVEVAVEQGGVRTCDRASDRDAMGPYERRSQDLLPVSDAWTWGGGITAADLDADGWLDVLVALEVGVDLYKGNPGQVYESSGQSVFGTLDLTHPSGTSVADYDGDGDLDIYVMRILGAPIPDGAEGVEPGRNRLLRNDGVGILVDVTDEAGVDACGPHHRTGVVSCYRSMASSWGDLDADGDLDLFVGNYGFVDETDGTTQEELQPAEPSFLYRNNGDGTFTDISDMLPDELQDGFTYAGGLMDLDDDGDLDLYTVNDFGSLWPNRVLWNEGGELVFDPQDSTGLVISMTGMGLGIGDLNGDGRPDLAIPEWSNNYLLESRVDNGIWIDTSDIRGFVLDEAANQRVGWGSLMGDVDNDGDLDIATQYGHLRTPNSVWWNPERQPDGLYLNDGAVDFHLTDVAPAWLTADTGMTRGLFLADLNRDGWLDMGKRSLGKPGSQSVNMLYLSRCGLDASITVHLRHPASMNRFGVGARVTVRAGGTVQTRQLTSGGTGYASQGPLELHFGLGAVDVVDSIEVVWPDGEVSVSTDIGARQEITLVR